MHNPSYDTMVFQEEEIDTTMSQEKSNFETEIEWALRVKNISVLERLLKEKDTKGRTKFHLACKRGDHDLVANLLNYGHETGINFNEKDSLAMTGFIHACKENHHKVIALILKTKEKLNIDA